MGLFGFDSIKDMFDGGGPGASSSSSKGSGGTQGDKSSSGKDWSPGPSTSTSKTGTSVSGQTGGGSSANNVDRPVGSGGSGGGYTSIKDMFDGGGPGQSGSKFGGLFGGISNALGFTPAASGASSGAVYQGPNINGTAGYLQDPGLMGVDTSTGYITSDNNTFRPAPDFTPTLTTSLMGEDPPPSTLGLPPLTPTEPPPEEETEVPLDGGSMLSMYPQFMPQTLNLAPGAAGPGTVGAPDLIYEDYLARLMQANNLLKPVPLVPIPGPSPMQQGIGSLMPPGGMA